MDAIQSRRINRRQALSRGGQLLTASAALGLTGCSTERSRQPTSHEAPAAQNEPATPSSQPNIVLVMLDDAGVGDLVPESPLIATPRLDEFARQGMTFNQMYAGSSTCTPSRAALLTGRYAPRVGLPYVLQPKQDTGLSDYEMTLPEILRGQGYRTGIFGKWHLGARPRHNPVQHGFDRYVGLSNSNDQPPVRLYEDLAVIEKDVDQRFLTRRYTDEAINFIERNKNDPFFVYLPHTAPHIPLHVEPGFEGRSAAGAYGDVLHNVDFHFGRLLDKLDELSLTDNTIVILTSDNGPWFQGSSGGLRGRKTEEYEGGVRVPFWLRWPNQVQRGSSCDDVVSFLDMLPTLSNLAGAKAPTDRIIDGLDMSATLKQEPPPTREALYYFYGWSVSAIRVAEWKLHIPYQQGVHSAQKHQLFNIEADPNENYDLSSEYPDRVRTLRGMAKRCDREIKSQKRAAKQRAGALR